MARRHRSSQRAAAGFIALGLLWWSGIRVVGAMHLSSVDGLARAEQVSADLDAAAQLTHLVISEVMTGGASASDEFIELYNPTGAALPVEGLELIYVTASGSTVTAKARWSAGASAIPSGAHLLVANAAGAFAALADVVYTNGLAATGGSVALRIDGASTAIDAVGWGNATSTWLEPPATAAVAAGHSLERLPGGAAGSGQDTEQNSVDFADQPVPQPQNAAAPPISPPTPAPTASPSASPTADPSATADTPTPTAVETSTASPSHSPSVTPSASATPQPPSPSPTPASGTPSPSPAVVPIADARTLPDGSVATVEGVALTASTFSDGGGYASDASGGIAVLLPDGSFERGQLLRISGELDDRFSQRTLRATAAGISVLGSATEPAPQPTRTGAVGESLEGELAEVTGTVVSAQSVLTTGIALDVDDGSGVLRVLVGSTTGIATDAWTRGSQLHLVGVVGQRDSSGTGLSGYRLQPRDTADVLAVIQPSSSPSPSASPTPGENPDAIGVGAARALPFNSRALVRGIVTLPADLVETGTAAIQDATGCLLLRLSGDARGLTVGQQIEAQGTRSTKAGMETLRVTEPPRTLGTRPQPDARQRDTGALGEADEACLVAIRGAVTLTPRRTSAGNVYFDVDDGSGPIRVFVTPGTGIQTDRLLSGTTVAIAGVLGQETSGRQPERGYRLWPRAAADLEIVAQPTGVAPSTGGTGNGGAPGTSVSSGGVPAGNPGRESPPVTQQHRPQLVASAGPTSRAVASPPAAPPVETETEGHGEEPLPVAAGLLLGAALLLGGAGAAAAPPGFPGRLLAVIRARIRTQTVGDEPNAEADDPHEEPIPALSALVPLQSLEPVPVAAHRAAAASRRERERILPPT
ncbi:MAG TPA: lamin tail domain-containing protein [Candidatus Limnocylindria bacterium]|nr:lamin tail domain-containing protein [Candidatus Limnocylindria bacterium]